MVLLGNETDCFFMPSHITAPMILNALRCYRVPLVQAYFLNMSQSRTSDGQSVMNKGACKLGDVLIHIGLVQT